VKSPESIYGRVFVRRKKNNWLTEERKPTLPSTDTRGVGILYYMGVEDMERTAGIDGVLKELKKDYNTAEEWLLYYQDRLKEYYKDLNYIRSETQTPEVFVQTGPGNTVMQKVISLAELEKRERWLIVVEMVRDMLGPKKTLFLQLRCKAAHINKTVNGREVWRNYVQVHYAEEMARQHSTTSDKFWLHDNTITNWWNEIVGLVRLVALKKGCL
jgi:hypothetical protein